MMETYKHMLCCLLAPLLSNVKMWFSARAKFHVLSAARMLNCFQDLSVRSLENKRAWCGSPFGRRHRFPQLLNEIA